MGDHTPRDSGPTADSTLDGVLRELARPAGLGSPAASTLKVPAELDLPRDVLAEALGLEAEPAEPEAGALLDGRYQLERVLARGGMGVVYAARNVRTGQRVAIKWILARRLHSSQRALAVERFRREARAAATVRHPNVIDVYDVGGPDDVPFLVMELLEGESLRARMDRGPLTWSEACAIMVPVLRGVAAAHRTGTVHRDLKPDNIFLCRVEGAEALPKVLDFGVAAMRPTSVDDIEALTRTGTMVGTPTYMPLEQLTGHAVDERADVFALGVVLYEMLSGALPFPARTAGDLAVRQATGEPEPLTKHRPELRGRREAAVLKALARDPAQRHDGAEAFQRALVAATSGGPRRRFGWLAATLLLGLSSWWLWATLQRAETAPAVVEQQRTPQPRAVLPVAPAQVAEPATVPATGAPPASEPAPSAAPRPRRPAPLEPAGPRREPGELDLKYDEF
jgi:tRNA A-37 threonylcarbamoyl transferase component Bud32